MRGNGCAGPEEAMSDRPLRPKLAKTPFERMTDLTRRLIAVPKAEIAKGQKGRKRKKRKH